MNRRARQNATPLGGMFLLAALALGAAWWQGEIEHRANHHDDDYAIGWACPSCAIENAKINKTHQSSTEARR